MESLISRLIFHNWQQKLVALGSALIIWFFVSHSIIETKIIPGVPVRIVNLPADKTILGLNPNGLLSKRITLTLTGSKSVIRDIEPGDLEALIDASIIDHDDWIIQINKKNLVSLNPAIDLKNNIKQVSHTEHVIRLRPLITDKVPITILPPLGQAPEGYEYLGIWPLQLTQTLSGAEEEIQNLKIKGLEVVFDLNEITKKDLDSATSNSGNLQNDEISFLVPAKWKKIAIPFHNNSQEEFNDKEAAYLRIDFLRKELLPIKNLIPIRVFYPLKSSTEINPSTYPLEIAEPVLEENHITLFSKPLFVQDVSRLFLDIVRQNMEITLVAAPKAEREQLQWTVNIIDTDELEDIYTAFLISQKGSLKNGKEAVLKNREVLFRKRFHDYLQKLDLLKPNGERLEIEGKLEDGKVKILNQI
ncbi:MAG TPA: hypothetical protein PLC42_08285 [Parachlamydiaceae bacterium]|nr:hypothetical protein [Parachlamydiaceae bacterium]